MELEGLPQEAENDECGQRRFHLDGNAETFSNAGLRLLLVKILSQEAERRRSHG